MNRTLNSLQKIKFNPLVNRINFEQGKKKYLLNKHSVKPTIIRKYTTFANNQPHDDDNKPPNDKNVLLLICIFIGSWCCTDVLMYKKYQ